MLPIWKGLGWLAPAIFIAAFVDVQMLVDGVMGEDFYQQNRWVKLFSVVAVALLLSCSISVRDSRRIPQWNMRALRCGPSPGGGTCEARQPSKCRQMAIR